MNVRIAVLAGTLLGCGAAQPAPITAAPVTVSSIPPASQVEQDADVRCVDFAAEVTGDMTLDAPHHVAAAPTHAFRTESGLATCVLVSSTSEDRPRTERDRVTVHYTGWSADGERFDSSVERGSPASFGLDRVIAGWTEGVLLMRVGERRRLWIPEALAYQGRPGRPAGDLVFDVEQQSVEQQSVEQIPEMPPVPADVAVPPSTATRTSSGLHSRVLVAGQGSAHPTATSRVTVHYTGWTTDGEMFDSSITRGRPSTFPLSAVIAGWTEGLQLMVAGETRRFWIPANLAYAGRAGTPQGALTFDVELISFVP